MKCGLLSVLPLLGTLMLGLPVQGDTVNFAFNGSGVSGSGTFTYASPVGGAAQITDITGTFSDANTTFNGNTISPIVNANITGLVAIHPLSPLPAGVRALDFSQFDVAGGVPSGQNPPPKSLSYDNTLYLGGSPAVCADYPFSGGFLDVYGVLFTLSNGDVVGLWSNGTTPGGLTYGVAVADANTTYDYVGNVAATVPSPAALSAGLVMLGGLVIRRRRKISGQV